MGRAKEEKRLATASLLSSYRTFLIVSHWRRSATFGVGKGFHGIGVTAGDENDSSVGSDVIVFNNFPLLERFSACDELMWKSRNK